MVKGFWSEKIRGKIVQLFSQQKCDFMVNLLFAFSLYETLAGRWEI